MNNVIKKLIASGFGLGLLPVFPGSWGALVGVVWHVLSVWLLSSYGLVRLSCLLGIVLFSGVHYWLTPWAQAYWRNDDPKNFVLDEIVGYLCVPVMALPSLDRWWHYVLAFVVFRIFDAIKLPGARYIDRNIHNANGVLLDDVVSAIYTATVVSAVCYFV